MEVNLSVERVASTFRPQQPSLLLPQPQLLLKVSQRLSRDDILIV